MAHKHGGRGDEDTYRDALKHGAKGWGCVSIKPRRTVGVRTGVYWTEDFDGDSKGHGDSPWLVICDHYVVKGFDTRSEAMDFKTHTYLMCSRCNENYERRK
jgi:hypothetical protein